MPPPPSLPPPPQAPPSPPPSPQTPVPVITEELTPEQVEAVQTAGTVTSTTVAAAAVGATVAAGAAAAAPMAIALQRAVMFSDIAGAPANPTMQELGKSMQWVTGRFNFFGGGAEGNNGDEADDVGSGEAGSGGSSGSAVSIGGGGRRLRASGAAKRARGSQNDALRKDLHSILLDFLVIAFVFCGSHLSLLLFWRFGLNRRHYKQRHRVGVAPPESDTRSPPPSPPIAEGAPSSAAASAGRRIKFAEDVSDGKAKELAHESNSAVVGEQAEDPAAQKRRLEPTRLSRSASKRGTFMSKSAKKLARKGSVAKLQELKGSVKKRFPHFVALPDFLKFPNLEMILFVFMASSVTQVCASVVAGTISGSIDEPGLLALALALLVAIVLILVHEVLRLRRFKRRHAGLFVEEEVPLHHSEVDDPLLYGLAKCRLIRPRSRVLGGYEPPDEDNEEPYRTERLLARPFSLWRHEKVGDEYITMATLWLSDVGYGTRGTYYQITKIALLILAAFVAGIGFDASPDSAVAYAQAWLLMAIQAALAVYCLFLCLAGDRLEAMVAGLEAVCQAVKLLCDYSAAGIDRATVAAAWDAANTTNQTVLDEVEAEALSVPDVNAVQLRSTGLIICLVAILLPVMLTSYDLAIVPIVQCIDRRRHPDPDGEKPQTCLQCLFAALILPITLFTTFFGMSASTAKALGSIDQVTNAIEGDGTFDRVSFAAKDKDGDGVLSYEEFHNLVVTSGGADADLSDEELRGRFALLDVNGTGKVSHREYRMAQAAWRDGVLDLSEFEALLKMDPATKALGADEVQARFAALDVDGTGRINVKEFAIARVAWKDGMLDFAEFCALMRTTHEGLAFSVAELRTRFASIDVNGTGSVGIAAYASAAAAWKDGKLDFAEYCGLMRADGNEGLTAEELRKRFNAIDADGTGQISLAELQRATQAN